MVQGEILDTYWLVFNNERNVIFGIGYTDKEVHTIGQVLEKPVTLTTFVLSNLTMHGRSKVLVVKLGMLILI